MLTNHMYNKSSSLDLLILMWHHFLIAMNKLKKISLIFSFITLTIAILALATLNAIFIVGAASSFVMAVFYLYLNRARQTFKKDLLDALK